MKRITLIAGHYGSGKTELSVNLVINLKKEIEHVAILDMDIANPYFRSRERQALLEELGIQVHHNSFGYDITEDLPAISAGLKAPLENKAFTTIVDVGGDDSGARVLNQFKKYFSKEDADLFCVINGNRIETDNVEGCIKHVLSIQNETGIKVDGIINNTHMLRETTAEDILSGFALSKAVCEELELPLIFNVCERHLIQEVKAAALDKGMDLPELYPIDLYMRPSWLDR
ncbi:MAG: ATP-binding protein [Anaerovoracaceae bacterium]